MSGFKHSRRFWMLLMSTIYIYAYFPKGILSTTLCTTPTKVSKVLGTVKCNFGDKLVCNRHALGFRLCSLLLGVLFCY
ncbi:hypothetical protein HanPI659440_Chr09g0324531 [Helianthus annuus]|nr:hypothetical protein HanPI659440_Chr09g0324531 [Helianthus annuus]